VEAARIGEVYDTSTGLLDRLLLAFVAAHEVTTHELAAAERTSRHAAGTSPDQPSPDGRPGA
jgi:hypothetical protein